MYSTYYYIYSYSESIRIRLRQVAGGEVSLVELLLVEDVTQERNVVRHAADHVVVKGVDGSGNGFRSGNKTN